MSKLLRRVLICVFIIILSIAITVKIGSDNYWGKTVKIDNFSENLNGRKNNGATYNLIRNRLYKRIIENNGDIAQVNSAVIRSGTFEYDSQENVTTVKFIVDIESIKQSYQVSYQWGDEDYLDEYGTIVSCLPKKSLIYGDFNCQDLFTSMAGTNDPALLATPYSDYGYDITAEEQSDGKVVINIYLYACQVDEEEVYRDYALDYLKSQNVDLEDYTINYSSC